MSGPTLDDAHRLLICLAVAVRRRDSVLVRQVAEQADRMLSESVLKRSFSRLRNYGVSDEDMAWLSAVDL